MIHFWTYILYRSYNHCIIYHDVLSKHFSKVSDILTSLVDCCHWYLNWHVQTWPGSPGLESSWECLVYPNTKFSGCSVGSFAAVRPFLIVTWAGCFQCFPQVFSLTKTIATLKLWEIIDLKREQISVGSQISSSGSGSIFYLFKWNLIDASKWNVQGFCLGKVCVT